MTPVRRTHFFAGQLLTAEDLARDQKYFRERLRRHNRALHGWGVVYGLGVEVVPDDGTAGSPTVTVLPGYALSPQGDEIVVDEPVSRPLPFAAQRRLVAVRYDERLVDPLPVAARIPGDDTVQFAEVEETYAVEVLEASGKALDDPWVVLAAVAFDDDGHVVIDTSERQHARERH